MARLQDSSNLWQAFASLVASHPHATALSFDQSEVSFEALQNLAERCSDYLVKHGATKGDVVVLQLPKRLEAYALFLGCLRVGCPYVFADVNNPAHRMERILNRVRPKLLFTTGNYANHFGETIVLADRNGGLEWLRSLDVSPGNSKASYLTGADPAYIMFTSGSTGEPKGAAIPHQGVLSLMQWGREELDARPGSRFTNINPLHFDNSVFDLYCGLLNGAAIIPIDTGELPSPVAWVKNIRFGRADTMFAVPTLFLILEKLGLLTPVSLPSVKTFVFGGEGFPIVSLRRFYALFASTAKLINVYGPTETSCISTSLRIDEEVLAESGNSFVPLGRMHNNFDHVVVGENARPVNRGEIGELWISGPCVGLGYYRNPEQTKTRFLQDPRHDNFRAICYRTGDLVREDDKGRLWFQGRLDNQVKLRGHRIELEEIELAIESIDGMRRAIAVTIVLEDEVEIWAAFVAERNVLQRELDSIFREKLPNYMWPSRTVQLKELPLNANGKIDRSATRRILETEYASAGYTSVQVDVPGNAGSQVS